ncbi:MAG: hypothetical protein WBQ09_16850 [Terriglobales bacterium]|jgi:hypothetical protein
MDRFHRRSEHSDTRNVRECRFCSALDPDFASRPPLDRMVVPKLEDTASAHLTEDGYVKHRIVELMRKRAAIVAAPELQRSA